MNVKAIIIVAVSSLSLAACGGAVDTGNMGVFTRYGKVVGEPVGSGYHYYNWITTDLNELSVRVQKWNGDTESYTKDFQQAKIAFTLSYALDPKMTEKVFKLYGAEWENQIVPQVVVQEIKTVTGVSTAIDLIEKRAVAQQRMQAAIAGKLRKRGVIVTSFELRDISYSKAFEDAVEQKQVAVEKANAARNRTVQIEEEAKQKIVTAKAEAEAMQIKSKALSSNPGLAQYEAVQKWDGVLPQNMYGGGVMPFIGVK